MPLDSARGERAWAKDVPGGVELLVLVQPRASRTKIVGEHDGRLKVALAEPAADAGRTPAIYWMEALSPDELLQERFDEASLSSCPADSTDERCAAVKKRIAARETCKQLREGTGEFADAGAVDFEKRCPTAGDLESVEAHLVDIDYALHSASLRCPELTRPVLQAADQVLTRAKRARERCFNAWREKNEKKVRVLALSIALCELAATERAGLAAIAEEKEKAKIAGVPNQLRLVMLQNEVFEARKAMKRARDFKLPFLACSSPRIAELEACVANAGAPGACATDEMVWTLRLMEQWWPGGAAREE